MWRLLPIDNASGLTILAYILMGLGLIGAVVPMLPGPLLIWSGALLWAWVDGFTRVGWPTLIIMAVLGLVAMGSDIIATLLTGRKAGMSWQTTWAAVIGGIIGGVFFSPLPVVGTLTGAILGALLGVVLVEFSKSTDWAQTWAAVKVYALAFLVGRLFELILCLAMLGIFFWNLWR